MLTRAARRQFRRGLRNSILDEYHQLALPFLCPAVSRCVARRQSSTTWPRSSSRQRTRSPGPSTDQKTQSRWLATTVEPTFPDAPFEHIPFERPSGPSRSTSFHDGPRPMSAIRRKDFSNRDNLSIVPDDASQLPHLRTARRFSMTGDMAELQQNVYACVQVGRMDRAALLIRFMNTTMNPQAPELHDVHSRYVSALMEDMLRAPASDKLASLQKWLELDMKALDIPIGPNLLAYVLKASLMVLTGPRLGRTLRRYLAWAAEVGEQEYDDVLSHAVFSDTEWETLMAISRGEPDAAVMAPAPQEDSTSAAGQNFEPDVSIADTTLLKPQTTSPDLDGPAEATPLRATDQKGLGLHALRRSLVSLQNHSVENFENEDGKDPMILLQERLEQDVVDSALERWREESIKASKERAEGKIAAPSVGAHVHQWVEDIATAVDLDLQRADEISDKDATEDLDLLLVAPFLRMIDTKKAVATAIMAYMDTMLVAELKWTEEVEKADRVGPKAAPIRQVLGDIGSAVIKEARAERILEPHQLERLSKLPTADRRRMVEQMLRNKRREEAAQSPGAQPPTARLDSELSPSFRYRIAAYLLTIILKKAMLPVTKRNPDTGKQETDLQPLGTHNVLFRDGKRYGVVEMNQELVAKLKREPPVNLIAKYLPMLAPPKPWVGLKDGGYLTSQTPLVRFKEDSLSSMAYLKLAHKRGDMGQVYAALNGLGKVAWRINQDVFNVMTQVWNTGESFAQIAPLNPSANMPSEPDPSDKEGRRRWRKAVKSISNQMSSYHSQRCFQNFQLEVAKAFVNDDFYCPHNIDFRGRAYPLPPYLNHMGPDYIRALFLFATGKPLGDRGLYWLKVHLANVFGNNKAPLSERVQFVDDHISDIYDSASKPLDGQQWWLKSEDPWQTLAACMELRAALDSPVPAEYVSQLPIQQDGSCNGLQHYAALGGDELGAQQVNLQPGEKPGDVYSGVLDLVNEAVARDAEKGHPHALVLKGRLTRKCVKQPVMTNVYGVTFIGASKQVRKQLVDVIPKSEFDSGKADIVQLSAYMANQIFAALRTMFTGANLIQHWLNECGTRISMAVTPEQLARLKERLDSGEAYDTSAGHLRKPNRTWINKREVSDYQFKSSIVWTTPLGMPVVQPYRESSSTSLETSFQMIRLYSDNLSDAVSKRRQLQGLPPNFIHSLDATHMMLTSLRFSELGLSFAAIHDSFWTHASDTDTLHAELRDAFVRMHSDDIIGRLREEFVARYKDCFHWVGIPAKSPAGKSITSWYRKNRKGGHARYRKPSVQSVDVMKDAILEQERQRLLASDDPAEVARGKEMVTPASICEAEEAALGIDAATTLPPQPESDAPATAPHECETPLAYESTDDALTGDIDERAHTLAEPESPGEALPSTDAAASETSSGQPGKNRKANKPSPTKLYFWRPMSFPEAPPKGAFDVQQVRDSTYFFS